MKWNVERTENENVFLPYFIKKDNFLALKAVSVKRSLKLKLAFKTFKTFGLLVFQGDINKKSDYFSLSLENGHLVFRYFLGKVPVAIKSEKSIIPNKWYMVSIMRPEHSSKGILRIENKVFYGTNTLSSGMETVSPLYLGGVPSATKEQVKRFINYQENFNGVISFLSFNEKAISMEKYEAVHNVDNYNTCVMDSPCRSEQLCENTNNKLGHQCFNINFKICQGCKTFHCKFVPISHDSDSCPSTHICQPQPFSDHECNCKLGLNGRNCDTYTKITPSFNGHSYLKIRHFHQNLKTNISLDVKPTFLTLPSIILFMTSNKVTSLFFNDLSV